MLQSLQSELQNKGSIRFYIRAVPGAAKTGFAEKMDDDSIKIRIASPPEGGKANAELVVFLASVFGVAKNSVKIVSGRTSRMKLIQIGL